MPSKLMEALQLAANWMKIEGVEAVSANQDLDQIEVYVGDNFKAKQIPVIYKGFKVKIKKPR